MFLFHSSKWPKGHFELAGINFRQLPMTYMFHGYVIGIHRGEMVVPKGNGTLNN